MTKAIVVRVEGDYVITAQGADLLSTLASQATTARDEAVSAAAAALAAAGVGEYPDTGAGLSGTTEGETFWVDMGDGTGQVYRHDPGPTATPLHKFIIDPTDSGAADIFAGGVPTKAALASSTGADMVGYSQDLNYAEETIGRALKRFILITEAPYNADPTGGVSASAAFQAAIDAAAGAPCEIVAKGDAFLIDTSVVVGSDVTIKGDGSTEFRGPGNMTMFVADDRDRLKFKDVAFASTTSSPLAMTRAVRAHNCNDVAFIRCRFDRVIVNIWSTKAQPCRGLKILGCEVAGDYTNSLAMDIVNIFDIRGIDDVLVSGSSFTATNYYRLFKFSTAVIAGDPYRPDFPGGRVVFNGNILDTGSDAAQQIFDFSFGTRDMAITGNVMRIHGASVPFVLHAKSAYEVPKGHSIPNKINISGNTIICGPGVGGAIYMESDWGLPGYAEASSITMASNEIISEAAVTGLITVKGFDQVNISGLNADQALTNYGRAIIIQCCARITIDGVNIDGGCIEIQGIGGTQDGRIYTKSPESILIGDFIIGDFQSQGGVKVENCAALDELTIHDGHVRNRADQPVIQGAIYLAGVTASRVNVHDVTANLADSGKNRMARSGPYAVAHEVEHGNSWNQATVDWDPAAITKGNAAVLYSVPLPNARLGDWVRVSAPGNLQGLQATAYVASAGVANIVLANNVSASVDLGNMTWRLAYGRG